MNNSRRIKFLVAGVILLLGVYIATSLLSRPKTTGITQQTDVPASFEISAPYGENSLVLANGRAFVEYDYTTGQSKELSPHDPVSGLADIDTLTASDDGAYLLFHDTVAAPGGQLETALKSRNLDINQDYWWVLNVASQTYVPLPNGILLAKFNGNRVDTLTRQDDGEFITGYQLPGLERMNSIPIPGSTDFWAYGDGYLLQIGGKDIAYTKDGVVTDTYFEGIELIGASADKQRGVGTVSSDGEETGGTLVELDFKDKTTKDIANSISGNPAYLSGGSVLYLAVDSKSDVKPINTFARYDLATGKKDVWQLSGAATDTSRADIGAIQLALNDTTALLRKGTGGFRLLGSQVSSVKNSSGHTAYLSVQGHTINLTEDTGRFIVTSQPPDQTLSIAAAESRLQSDGYDPALYYIEYQEEGSD